LCIEGGNYIAIGRIHPFSFVHESGAPIKASIELPTICIHFTPLYSAISSKISTGNMFQERFYLFSESTMIRIDFVVNTTAAVTKRVFFCVGEKPHYCNDNYLMLI